MARDAAYRRAEQRIEKARQMSATRLVLSGLGLTALPDAITNLANLKELNLYDNKLGSLPDAIANLTKLQRLDLGKNQLSSLPELIGNLTKLERLNLGGNQLRSLPNEISNLTNLQSLDLSKNQLSSLPSAIASLINLYTLDLRFNKLSFLPKEIASLTKLLQLVVFNNQLKTLPDTIGSLTNLQELVLSQNCLTSLPEGIASLTNLQTLYLDDNQLSFLPKGIASLTNLRKLYLNSNDLSSLPEGIFSLINLQILNLINNQLSSLPEVIGKLINLKILVLDNNPLPIPPEIIRKGWGEDSFIEGDPQAVIAYYLASNHPLNEAKVILVGEADVGKTSLVNRLLDQGFNPYEIQTDGITVRNLEVTFPSNTGEIRTVKLHLWDFGGQEIMHTTHQFFLTKRSLYLLVLNNRDNEDQNRIEYWLKTIESFGSNSPVIIVGNQSDQSPLDLDKRSLQKKYPNIKAFIATSCQDGTGIEQLQQAINYEISNLKHVGDLLPERWFQVKEALENLQKDYIPYDDYTQICEANQIPEDQTQRILVSLLHDLGIVLNFHDDPLVSDTHVINPEWVTTAIYTIINDPTLMTEDKGILTYSRLNQILPKPAYPTHKHPFIIAMMKKFELCFAINDQQVLIPNLLPKEAPATLNRNDWNGALRFQYHYSILPQSVISRFIVKMHQRIEAKTYWRSGVVLISEGNRALITADLYDKKIFIAINGTPHTRRDFLSEIRGCFFSIHDSFARLPVEEKVPLPQSPEIVVSFQHLLDLEEIGEETFVPEGTKEKVKVKDLLNGVGKTITNFPPSGTIPPIQIINQPIMSNTYQHHSGSGDNRVDSPNITNNYNSQNLAQAAQDIKALIDQLSSDYDTTTPSGKMRVSAEVIEKIETNPTLKTRTLNALKEAGTTALEEAINHPIANVVVALLKGFLDP